MCDKENVYMEEKKTFFGLNEIESQLKMKFMTLGGSMVMLIVVYRRFVAM